MNETPNLPAKWSGEQRLAPIRKRRRQPQSDLTELRDALPSRVQSDLDFLPDAQSIIETPYPTKPQLAIILICCALVIALSSAWMLDLTTYAIAPGQIVASGQAKVVEPLEKGQILTVRVNDGDLVKKGDVLLELDPTVALAAQTVVVNKLESARAESSRRLQENLSARADPVNIDPAIVWDDDIPPEVRDREFAAMRADLQLLSATISDLMSKLRVKEANETSLMASIAAEKSLLEASTEQLGMYEKLATMGWDSRAQVIRGLQPTKQQQIALATLQGEHDDAVAAIRVINSQIALARETFVTNNVQKLTSLARQIDELNQQLTKAKLNVAGMTLRAPISGAVTASVATTKGQVVNPGQQIFVISPVGATLEVEAYALNIDIGFVQEGAPVTVKVATFPYTRYGTIAGKVIRVAPDAITGAQALSQQKNGSMAPVSGSLSDTNAAQNTSDLTYPVTVALAADKVEADGRSYPITAGMSVVAEIETGRHRLIDYILYPLLRSEPKNHAAVTE